MGIVIIIGAAVLVIGYLLFVARGQKDLASASIVAVAAGCAGIALASFFAVRQFTGVVDEISRSGRVLPEITYGIWHASLLPMSAAMAAAIVTAIALLLLLATPSKPADPSPRVSRLWVVALALACGSAAVWLFRDAMHFVSDVIVPGSRHAIGVASIPDAILTRLFQASLGSAVCFLVALTLAAVMMRKPGRATSAVAIVALVLTLAVSAAFAAGLREYSGYHRSVYLYGPTFLARR